MSRSLFRTSSETSDQYTDNEDPDEINVQKALKTPSINKTREKKKNGKNWHTTSTYGRQQFPLNFSLVMLLLFYSILVTAVIRAMANKTFKPKTYSSDQLVLAHFVGTHSCSQNYSKPSLQSTA